MYDHHTVTDFILDKDFQEWVHSPTPESEAYWQNIRLLYPHQEENIEAARKMLLSMKFRDIPEADIRSDTMLTNILGKIEEYEQDNASVPHSIAPPSGRKIRIYFGVRVAASILLVLGLIAGYYVWQQAQSTLVQTAYGETREVKLPDGSLVTLNGNSSIRYAAQWAEAPEREVWLEGEAYFKVVKLASEKQEGNLKKFLVHTSGLDIEVLGTEFNVHQRQEKSQVVLTEGKVKVNVRNGSNPKEVYLQPGELLEYSPQVAGIIHKVVDPADYLHWQDRQLVFEGESLREVAVKLQEIFGYTVVFQDPNMAEYQFRGIVPFDDPDVLIVILKQAYGISIEKDENTLTFREE